MFHDWHLTSLLHPPQKINQNVGALSMAMLLSRTTSMGLLNRSILVIQASCLILVLLDLTMWDKSEFAHKVTRNMSLSPLIEKQITLGKEDSYDLL